jgi:hypothetical protein
MRELQYPLETTWRRSESSEDAGRLRFAGQVEHHPRSSSISTDFGSLGSDVGVVEGDITCGARVVRKPQLRLA